jgi:NAD(P)-dependent dehydrogenase (short-subunit alcohol dehydrogenase family)
VVVITGASSGFGLLTAVEVAKRGHHVYATMRDPTKGTMLDEACRSNNVDVQQRRLVVTDTASIEAVVGELVDTHGRIDALVNNAGAGSVGFAYDLSEGEVRHHLEINLLGAMRCTRAVVGPMRSTRSGTIVNVSSIAGRSAVPFLSAYSASKFALEGWSECLRYELAGTGLRVCLIEPGTFRTPMYAESPAETPGAAISAPARQLRKVQSLFFEHARRHGGDPEKVARKIADVVDNCTRFRVVIGRDARLELLAKRLLPDEAFGWAMERFVWRSWANKSKSTGA